MAERVTPGTYTHKTGGGEWVVTDRTATHTETLEEGVIANVSGNNWFVPLALFERDFRPFRAQPILPATESDATVTGQGSK